MKWQIHNIQVLLANELDQYKDKKGVVQDKEVFLYKLYAILSETSRPTTLEPILLK